MMKTNTKPNSSSRKRKILYYGQSIQKRLYYKIIIIQKVYMQIMLGNHYQEAWKVFIVVERNWMQLTNNNDDYFLYLPYVRT